MPGVKGRSGGRNRLPSAVKILRGTDQPCRMPKDEPKPEVRIPAAPRSLDATERRRYDALGAELLRDRIVTAADGDALAQLARAVVRVERLSRAVRKVGEFAYEAAVDADGKPIVRAAGLTIEARALQTAEEWLAKCNARFGRDPQSRATVKVTAPPAAPTEREARKARFFGGA